MLDYYKNELDVAEMQVALARDGYEKKVNELAVALKDVSVEEAEKLIDDVKFAKEALSGLEQSRDWAKVRYQEEYDKPENAQKRAKEVLFGGNE